jgi:hypothetical protein
MKRRAHAPLMTMLLLCALAPAALTRCGGSANDGGGLGTETGNPPLIEKAELHLAVTPEGIRLIGNPGAVTAGATVSVTNQRTGETASVAAASDGSVDMLVVGTASDTYRVTVVSGGRSATITITVADTPRDLATVSCATLLDTINQVASETFDSVDVSCSTNSDCVALDSNAGNCLPTCPYSVPASAQGRDAAVADSSQRTAGACGEIERRDCPFPIPSCEPQAPWAPVCEQGQCVSRALEQLSCSELSDEATRRREQASAAAARNCDVDTDCVLVESRLSCVASCGLTESVSVTDDGSAVIGPQLEQLEQVVCGQYEQAACDPPGQLPCEPMAGEPTATCEQGSCTVRYVQE